MKDFADILITDYYSVLADTNSWSDNKIISLKFS